MHKFNLNEEFLIFSGIGNPRNFREILIKNKFKIKDELIFADHYDYKKDEIENIISISQKNNLKIITTEKDFMKIKKFNLTNIDFVEVKLIIKNEKEFIDFLKNKIYE